MPEAETGACPCPGLATAADEVAEQMGTAEGKTGPGVGSAAGARTEQLVAESFVWMPGPDRGPEKDLRAIAVGLVERRKLEALECGLGADGGALSAGESDALAEGEGAEVRDGAWTAVCLGMAGCSGYAECWHEALSGTQLQLLGWSVQRFEGMVDPRSYRSIFGGVEDDDGGGGDGVSDVCVGGVPFFCGFLMDSCYCHCCPSRFPRLPSHRHLHGLALLGCHCLLMLVQLPCASSPFVSWTYPATDPHPSGHATDSAQETRAETQKLTTSQIDLPPSLQSVLSRFR